MTHWDQRGTRKADRASCVSSNAQRIGEDLRPGKTLGDSLQKYILRMDQRQSSEKTRSPENEYKWERLGSGNEQQTFESTTVNRGPQSVQYRVKDWGHT